MLLNQATLAGITAGTVTRAYRSWLRPTVKTGGTLNTRIGQLAIDAVVVIDPATISDADAAAAGAESADALRATLRPGEGRSMYRIDFRLLGDDPRAVLRADDQLDDATVGELLARLARMDRGADVPWTEAYLRLIGERPGQVARELATLAGMERDEFKLRVRRLKALGLTESLPVGYRLAPRGHALLAAIDRL